MRSYFMGLFAGLGCGIGVANTTGGELPIAVTFAGIACSLVAMVLAIGEIADYRGSARSRR